jgi:hypothetical protein
VAVFAVRKEECLAVLPALLIEAWGGPKALCGAIAVSESCQLET